MSARILVALDFDGTLAPLRRDPSAARLSERRRRLLRRLAASPGIALLVVSGRPAAFLRRALAGTGAALSGDHGWTVEGLGAPWRHRALARRAAQARSLARAARVACRRLRGARVETKTAAVAVHYREAPAVRRDPRPLGRALRGLLPRGWRLTAGKCVWEFRPEDRWGKGDAVLLAARRVRAREVVFVGDDRTDEEAFRRLGRCARTVKVGGGPTAARERVKGASGVDALLARLSL